MPGDLTTLAKKAATVTAVALLFIALAVGVVYAFDVLMLAFAGLLFTVFLNAIADFLQRHTPLGHKLSVALAVTLFLGVIAALAWVLTPQIITQVEELRQTLPESMKRLTAEMEQSPTGRWLLEHTPSLGEMLPSRENLLARITGFASSALGVLGALVVIFFIGLYVAIQPRLYTDGLLHLVPVTKRERAREVIAKVSTALRWWLMTQLVTMTVIGVSMWLLMTLLGLPFALTLGVLSALLTFIPNFGPVIAAVPAVLIGLQDSPTTDLWVAVGYTAIQLVESYILTPMLQQSAVDLPAAMVITVQLVLGILAGGIGLALAAPLSLVIFVLVRMLYVEDLLGDRIESETS